MKTFGAFINRVRWALDQRISPCPCGSTAVDRAQFLERDALIEEWRRYLPLSEVLDLRHQDLMGIDGTYDAENRRYTLSRFCGVRVPKSLVDRTIDIGLGADLHWTHWVFFGPRLRPLSVKQGGSNLD